MHSLTKCADEAAAVPGPHKGLLKRTWHAPTLGVFPVLYAWVEPRVLIFSRFSGNAGDVGFGDYLQNYCQGLSEIDCTYLVGMKPSVGVRRPQGICVSERIVILESEDQQLSLGNLRVLASWTLGCHR